MNYGADGYDIATSVVDWVGNIATGITKGKIEERSLSLQRDIEALKNEGNTDPEAFDVGAVAPYAIGSVLALGVLIYVLSRKRK